MASEKESSQVASELTDLISIRNADEHEKESSQLTAIQSTLLSKQPNAVQSLNLELEPELAFKGASMRKSHRERHRASVKTLSSPPTIQSPSTGKSNKTDSLKNSELIENVPVEGIAVRDNVLLNSDNQLDEVTQTKKSHSLEKVGTKRKRTTDSILNEVPPVLSKTKKLASEVKAQHSDYAALEIEELEERTLQQHASSHHEDIGSNKSFPLLYNECSLVAISNWVLGSTLPLSRCLIDSNNRRCTFCKKWGHYEYDCLLRAEASLASRIVGNQSNKPEDTQNDRKETHAANLDEAGSKYVVETCHGFIFEQRACSEHPTWNKEQLPEGYSALSTIEIDGSLISSVSLDG